MQDYSRFRVALVRGAVVAAAVGGVFVLRGLPAGAWPIDALVAALLGSWAVGTFVPPSALAQRGTTLVLLTTDLILVAALGCLLVAYQGGPDTRLAFLAAFIVANLVAMVGHSMATGLLGGLAGTMVLGLSIASLNTDGVPAFDMGFAQALILLAIAQETAFFSFAQHGQEQRSEMATLVAQQVAVRETEAEELSSFMLALVEVATSNELCEVVLEHLRTHYPMRAHAVALGNIENALAVWQEDAALDPSEIESRKQRLQHSLRRAGCEAEVRSMRFRSLGSARVKTPREPRTFVEVPIQLSGDVVGVLLLADPNPGALAPHRIGALTDIARRTAEAWHRLERQHAQQTRRTTLILREMRDGIMLLDAEGQILIANPAARRAIARLAERDGSRRPKRLGTTSLEELGKLPPGITRRFRCHIPGATAEEGRHLACTGVSVMDGGRRVGTLVTLSDVTDEDRARQRLMESERMTLVGQTLAGVAHELNNPLAALMGYADLLRAQKAMPEDLAGTVNQMRKQAVRATRIVKNLLNFARRGDPERVRTNLGDLIEETIELFVYEARIGKVDIHMEIDQSLPRVIADRHAIQQILVNLIQNALHALENVPMDARSLTIKAAERDGAVEVSFSDSGPGIRDELRARIFEPFFTTKGASKGTGLGLALSRSIAQDHDGELLLAPFRNGEGARFNLRLPPADEETLVAPTVETSTRIVVPHSVLVVDDEDTICDTVKAQLSRFGSAVDSADSVEAAQDLLGDRAYDVVLVDLRMPGSSGLELHRAIAARDPALARRTVFMTGDFVNDDLLRAVKRTGVPLLEKPFTEEELTSMLAKASTGPEPETKAPPTTKVHVPTFPTTTTS